MMDIKIIFVIPDMSYLWDYKQQFSLGILYLSSVLKFHGCKVEIFDSNVDDIENIPEANIYAFSAAHSTYQSCVSLAKSIAVKYPHAKRIVGGSYVTLSDKSMDDIFNTSFVGESEDTIIKYLKDLSSGNQSKIYTPDHEVCLDDLQPDRDLLPDDYIRTESIFAGDKSYTDGGATSIMFSRGCPYHCAFCASAKIYKNKVRYRKAEDIVEEVQGVIDNYGIKQFRVQDDTFTGSKKYFKDLANKLEPLDIYYRCSTRANHVDEEIAELLYSSGCREVGMGIEVANDGLLKKMKKGETVAQMENAVRCLKETSIKIRCFFMLGLPSDSLETIQANIDFIENNNIEHVTVSNFIPFPGTHMYDHQKEYGVKAIKNGRVTVMNFASHIPLAPNISRLDMPEEEHVEIMRVFYDYLLKKEFIH